PGPYSGSVRFGDSSVGGVAIPASEAPLAIDHDRLRLAAPVTLSLLGGDVELSALSVASAEDAEASLRLDGLDAATIGRVVGYPGPLEGFVSSDGPLRIRARPKGIDVLGSVTAHTLGGSVSVSGIRFEDPYSIGRRLHFDADLVDLDLEKISRSLAYGEITGNLNGEARDLVASGFGLESLTLRFAANETDDRPTAASVKAIRQIPFLSSEGDLTLNGFLFNMINSFGYSRFGAVAVLRGYRFVIPGRHDADGDDVFPGRLAPAPRRRP